MGVKTAGTRETPIYPDLLFSRCKEPKMEQSLYDRIHALKICDKVAGKYLEPSRVPGRFDCPRCGRKSAITATPSTFACWKDGCHEQFGRDAVGLAALALGCDRATAAKAIANEFGLSGGEQTERITKRTPPPRTPQNRPVPVTPDPDWLRWITRLVEESHDRLQARADQDSRAAWDYLINERRLASETILAARLGFNPAWVQDTRQGDGKPLRMPPGIVLPWHDHDRRITGANVRRFHADLPAKYLMVTGSCRASVYPGLNGQWARWTGPVLIVEGEFDALIGNQELNGLLPVVTIGGSQSVPWDSGSSAQLHGTARLFICTDLDAAGESAWKLWSDFSPKAVRIHPPGGKDLTESVQAGADLRAWITGVCTDHGIDLHSLPGLIWERPPGTIRGRLLEE